MMPGVDGLEFPPRGSSPATPPHIILLKPNTGAGDRRRDGSRRCDYLTKPIDRDGIRARVQVACESSNCKRGWPDASGNSKKL